MTKKRALPALVAILLAAGFGYAVRVRVLDGALEVTTGLLLLAAVAAGLIALAEVGVAMFSGAPSTRASVRVLVVTTAALLFVLELVLRFGFGTYTTYLERNERGLYRPLYVGIQPSWFHNYSAGIEYAFDRPEFRFPRKTNSLGIPDREIPKEKADGEYRVIAVGDSYTEGVGTAYDETWIKAVERSLAGHLGGRTLTAFNAGVSGSDPCFEYILVKEKLVSYRPDLVIMAINASDVSDVMIRGGLERFRPDGTTYITRQPPPWEWLYGLSYAFRHVIHDALGYNYLFIRQRDLESETRKAVDNIDQAVTAFVALGRDHGFQPLIVLHPDNWEASHQEWGYDSAKLVTRLKPRSDVPVIDVLEWWKAHGVLANNAAASMYWQIDGHNNSRGYAALGGAVASEILAARVLDRN